MTERFLYQSVSGVNRFWSRRKKVSGKVPGRLWNRWMVFPSPRSPVDDLYERHTKIWIADSRGRSPTVREGVNRATTPSLTVGLLPHSRSWCAGYIGGVGPLTNGFATVFGNLLFVAFTHISESRGQNHHPSENFFARADWAQEKSHTGGIICATDSSSQYPREGQR